MNARTLALLAGLALSSTALSQAVQPTEPVPAEAPRAMADAPAIEVVFVLDTTGSMSGLIEGAKTKIWSIANAIATADPRPAIRMGLVGYRDRGDEYVTRLTPLTDDLDAVYSNLMDFTANGGGDGPESVNQALNEAVHAFAWSDDDRTLRLIYLVGDAPPHMDYEQDIAYTVSCEQAAKAGIIVNTIQCGADATTTPIWREIARAAEGEFFAIEQSGGAVAIETPFDSDLATLSRELDATLVFYGDSEVMAAQSAKMDAAAEIEAGAGLYALAERAEFKCRDIAGATFLGQQELVADCLAGKAQLDTLDRKQLPLALQDMDATQLRAYIDTMGRKRTDVQTRMVALSQRRDAFLAANQGEAARSFDASVVDSLLRQSARIGLTFKAPPEPPPPATETPSAAGDIDPASEAPASEPASEPR